MPCPGGPQARRQASRHGDDTKSDVKGEGICRLIITEAAATLRMKARDAVRLITGRLSPTVAFMTGKARPEGELRALMVL